MRNVQHYEREVATIGAEATAREVGLELRSREVGSLVVMDGKEPVGIVTDRDLLRQVIAIGRDAEETVAKDIMSHPLVHVDASDPLERVVEEMSEHGVRRVAVLHNRKLTGIVSLDDVLVLLSEEIGDLAEGTRRSARTAGQRRFGHEIEGLFGEVGEQIDRLRGDVTDALSRRLGSVRERIGLRH